MTYDSTKVVAAARRARARAIGHCIATVCADLWSILRTRPLFHEERRDSASDWRTR